ncbi:calcium/sodium antiporter [Candidatus Gracilibacteria bacterium]|nr:calcium/sodium antiporter [Candidatus Gracilibacteria bacterium]MCF7819513.1 calcium/sodium antiporter [Candidatus Gracilibacteria bacterium]
MIFFSILSLFGLLLIFYWLAKICDEYFVGSLEIITQKLKISEDVAGASFMAVGSSAPELFTAIIALTKVGSENIGAGTIVGSAIFNVLVIIGASALVHKTLLNWRTIIRDVGFYMITLTLLLFTFWDGEITRNEAFWYLALYALYIFVLSQWKKWIPAHFQVSQTRINAAEKKKSIAEYWAGLRWIEKGTNFLFSHLIPDPDKKRHLYGITFTISVVLIAILSWAMIELAVFLAHNFGIPQGIIALTVLAAGTSIPDLLSSIIASKRGAGDMAVSNALGSNTFDILIGLGLPWLIYIFWKGGTVDVGTENLFSSAILLFATVILFAAIAIGKRFQISKPEGIFLILIYIFYLCSAILMTIYPDLL